MDVDLPSMDGLETTRQLRAVLPQAKIVMCTSAERNEECLQAIQAGAQGYLPKQIEPAGLSRALRGVCHDEAALSRAATTTLFEAFACINQTVAEERRPRSCEVLSSREEEVLWLLPTGMSNKEIASRLGISENAVIYGNQKDVDTTPIQAQARRVHGDSICPLFFTAPSSKLGLGTAHDSSS